MKEKNIYSDDYPLRYMFFNYYSDKVLGCEVSFKCDSNCKKDYNELLQKWNCIHTRELVHSNTWNKMEFQYLKEYPIKKWKDTKLKLCRKECQRTPISYRLHGRKENKNFQKYVYRYLIMPSFARFVVFYFSLQYSGLKLLDCTLEKDMVPFVA